MSFNPWVNQGIVIARSGTFQPAQPTVLYEGNSQLGLGAGNVFKMWYDNDNGANNSTNGVCYAESTDGITWTQKGITSPVVSVNKNTFSKLYKNGATYYLYTGPGIGPISVYTSSDGITFSLQNANGLVGGTQAWETGWNIFFGQLSIASVESGTWYGYYTSYITGTASYAIGLATSPDGINWTKSTNPANPVISTYGPSDFAFRKINGRYYGWSQIVLPNIPNNGSLGLPSDIMRYIASSPSGPWTPLGEASYYRTIAGEGISLTVGQVACPTFAEANGNVYMWYVSTPDGRTGTHQEISLAIASSMTMTQIVSSYEGIQNIPISGNASLNLNVLASDSFSGVDANPIGGNWTARFLNSGAGFVDGKLLSHAATSTVAGKNADCYWNALSWAADQWSQVTVGACAASSYVGVILRADHSAPQNVNTSYRLYWNGVAGSAGTWHIDKYVANAFTAIANGALTLNIGDTLLGVAIGTNIMLYWNGFLMDIVSDSSIAAGYPGFMVAPITAIANANLTAWSGGNFKSSPSLLYGISGALGIGGAGATVSWTGDASGSVTADGSGNYNTGEALLAGSYTITPTRVGYTFLPTSSSQTISGADITGINFVATSNNTGVKIGFALSNSYGFLYPLTNKI